MTLAPGQAIDGLLDVSLINPGPTRITAVRFNVLYDPALLTVTGADLASGLPADMRLTANLTTPGIARFTLTAPTGLPTGTARLVKLRGAVPAGAPQGAKQLLDVVDVFVNGNVAALDDDGVQVVPAAAGGSAPAVMGAAIAESPAARGMSLLQRVFAQALALITPEAGGTPAGVAGPGASEAAAGAAPARQQAAVQSGVPAIDLSARLDSFGLDAGTAAGQLEAAQRWKSDLAGAPAPVENPNSKLASPVTAAAAPAPSHKAGA